MTTDKRKKLLALNFFPAFVPPTSGGEQRYYMLYRHLSEQFDVTLLSATYSNAKIELVEHSSTFRELRVPKPIEVDQIHWSLETEGIGPECSALAVAMASQFDVEFAANLARLAADADAIIHESPFTLPYDTGAGSDGKIRIYNAYNVEYRLAEQMLKGEVGVQAAAFIRDLEARLIACSSAILATSEEERREFARVFGFPLQNIFLAPNGFEPPAEQGGAEIAASDDMVLFLGSGHPPNVEALHHIAAELAPALPTVTFNIVGSVCKAYQGTVPDNVKLLGFVSEAEKSAMLRCCAAAINPLSSGAGTNLKMLDYMAHGAPVVCTPIGARGLELVDGEQALICELSEFPQRLEHLLRDRQMAARIGRAGAVLVERKYAWSNIAAAVADVLFGLLDSAHAASRKRVLVVCDYEIHSARGGGQVRAKELLAEAGKEFDVTFLCLSDAADEIRRMLAPGVIQHSIPKTSAHRGEDQESSRNQSVSVADLVAAKHCLDNPALIKAFCEHVNAASVVIFEQCFLAPLLTYVPDSLHVMYSSQNVEATLKEAVLAVRADARPWIELTRKLEERMVRRADMLLCVSEADRQAFMAAYAIKRSLVIENGVRMPSIHRRFMAKPKSDGRDESAMRRPIAVFVGSAHPPNVRAAQYIIDELATQQPDVVFALVGAVCDAVSSQSLPDNVILLGFLERREKEALFAIADLAVNPLFEGSGSSLKVPDFLVAGVPMISSAVGARGFPGLRAGEHYIEAEASHMATLIPQLLADRPLMSRLSVASVEYVSTHLDWRVLGGKFRRGLRELMPRSGPCKVLVLTYRFGDPARGGAEVFLLNVLRELDKLEGIEFDVVAPAVGAIRDVLHFSADYDPPAANDGLPKLKGAVHLFPLDPVPARRLEDARALHSVWMRESLELGRNLAEELGDGLLGGWNFAELSNDRTVRWAARTAQIRLPADTHSMTLSGLALEPVQISIRLDNQDVGVKRLYRKFSFHQKLSGGGRLLELQASGSYQSEDVRELAYIVDSCIAHGPAGETEISLKEGMEERARRIPVERWVKELVKITEQRPRDQDQLFFTTRGPHSTELEYWLERACVGYDVILAQGVPFSTSVLGVQAGARNGIPVVVLPHYHMEDRYYHWRQFYDAFTAADAVIAAPAASKSVFFDLIKAKARVLAGGGFDAGDFSDQAIARGRAAFRRLHRGVRPYVLVLGRKAGAKNYRMVVAACDQLRAAGLDLDVVLIGPDDDGVPLRGEGVHYYGSQSREVVVGALADSLCLANMSDSESFGIVLLESWMANRPVVARSSTVAFAELVRHGENGFLADNAQDVAMSIRRYLEDEALAERHALAGKQLAAGYSWRVLAKQICEILVSVAAPRQ